VQVLANALTQLKHPPVPRLAVGGQLVRRKPEVLRCLSEVLLTGRREVEAAAVNGLRVAVAEERLQLAKPESEACVLAPLVGAVRAIQPRR
jgi:hypothetical protein